jgi:endonuclease/exonuclease/phosphatase (EEP) superfamily protein YafD
MSKIAWAAAGGLAGWAVARLAGADRFRSAEVVAAPLGSLTPYAAAAAPLVAGLARPRGAAVTAAVAGAALTGVVLPRAVRRRQPQARGPVLCVLTANLLAGQASAEAVTGLVRRTGADVLFVQELTGDAVIRLKQAGLTSLLPSEMIGVPADGSRGGGIYARFPLADVPRAPVPGAWPAGRQATWPAARMELPSGQSVELICVHPRPPLPMTSWRQVVEWREALAVVPPPALPPSAGPPRVLAGDFNATLDHAQFRRLLRLGHVDAACQAGNGLVPTWGPAPGGRLGLLTIDHVLVDPRCAVLTTSVHAIPGSDHRALRAQFRLPA